MISLKIILFKLLPHLPGANESSQCSGIQGATYVHCCSVWQYKCNWIVFQMIANTRQIYDMRYVFKHVISVLWEDIWDSLVWPVSTHTCGHVGGIEWHLFLHLTIYPVGSWICLWLIRQQQMKGLLLSIVQVSRKKNFAKNFATIVSTTLYSEFLNC